jgi:predicted RNA-binding Zn-ribbon protein involved in translation (DUF1610 family)
MGTLMIRCPQTGKAVWTGIEIDPRSFNTLPDASYSLPCPECGEVHAWHPRESWLQVAKYATRPGLRRSVRQLRLAYARAG